MKKIFLSLFLGMFFAQTVFCAAVAFKIKKPSTVEFAEKFNIQIEVTHPENYKVSVNKKSFSNEDVSITAHTAEAPAYEQNKIKQTFVFETLPFKIGDIKFPSLEWIVTRSDENKTTKIKSPEVELTVKEIAKPKDLKTDIYDILGVYSPFNYPLLIWLMSGLGLLVLAVFFLVRRKKTAVRTQEKLKDTRPADIIAFEEIENLILLGLYENGKIKQFYIKLSDILRDFLDRVFSLKSHKLTSFDLCRNLNKILTDKNILALIRVFLNSTDMVKFAKHKPDSEQKDKDTEILKNIITVLKPKRKEMTEEV